MFIVPSSLDFQVKNNPKIKCDFCPRKSQKSRDVSRNSNRSKLRCVICRSCSCQKHTHYYSENCVCDIRLGAIIPAKIPVVSKPRKCTVNSENCPSRTRKHCMNCLKAFCQKHIFCVCSPNCSPNEET